MKDSAIFLKEIDSLQKVIHHLYQAKSFLFELSNHKLTGDVLFLEKEINKRKAEMRDFQNFYIQALEKEYRELVAS